MNQIITVVGQGYVGFPLAVLITSQSSHTVYGYDINEAHITALSHGTSPYADVSNILLQEALATDRFIPTTDPTVIEKSNTVIICVPTPLTKHKDPDMRYIESAVDTIGKHIQPGTLVILESTTYPGTTEDVVAPLLERASGFTEGVDLFVAYSAERIDPGNSEFTLDRIPKVVSGVSPAATEQVVSLYTDIFEIVHPVTNPRTAEMTKLLENIYRLVNISLVNEMALLAGRMDIDIWEVIEAAKTKPYGFQAFYPGPGAGGHCIPLDPFYLAWKAREYNFDARFISLAGDINDQMPHFALTKVGFALNKQKKPIRESKVLVLGVAYKSDIGDYRESPVLTIIELLKQKHAEVSFYDPHVTSVQFEHGNSMNGMDNFSYEMLSDFDCVVIGTNHKEFDGELIASHATLVVDLRNCITSRSHEHVFRF